MAKKASEKVKKIIRDELRAAIASSEMYVQEVADKSGVNKRTIDKWVGASGTVPKVNDLYKVCKVLGVTVESIVDGEDGEKYVLNTVKKDHGIIQVSDNILPTVEGILLLDDKELRGIRANVEALAADKKEENPDQTETVAG